MLDIPPSHSLLSASRTSPCNSHQSGHAFIDLADAGEESITLSSCSLRSRSARLSPLEAPNDSDSRPAKRRKATDGLRVDSTQLHAGSGSCEVSRRLESDVRVSPKRKKRVPAKQPSTLDNFVNGVWHSLYYGLSLDPSEVIQQWQALENNGQPKLLHDAAQHPEDDCSTIIQDTFGRISVLTRKISQTSRACRSLEVIVQAYWVQCFDEHVAVLTATMTREQAKKTAISEACVDFNWSEKELRNRMAVWRGYHDIQKTGGWATLVFAGVGLYRFCKYRISFNEATFQTLRSLKHRFELAADTLHPRWRQLLGIIGASTERSYTGHPHDWVVVGSAKCLPLAHTYRQWDLDFAYTHLENSTIDEDVWGSFDPRSTTTSADDPYRCQVCGGHQSNDPTKNGCGCFPTLYGSTVGAVPVQVFRTANGKNNGLLACCSFARGAAIGEFIGKITSGLANLDVMVGETEQASYQIWQGRQGNHTRFVNHSCLANAQWERFIWRTTQRIVLVSKGIDSGDEITVDYSDTYWKVSL